ncbi:MAG: DUF2914 domain-containing protein [Hydrogenophilales bacterium CG17_big_fil_post_rev_8_21_14_2_50_63_12]|nr:MAG: DUF2914 domain-containing protein [Hydrogenophilales bacterium CG17_big_fil_post_rev_8_21_14_2_50_63_12]PIX95941.1 MAG: DUF2914 domain-containing protein [Hydrogenophilales bacterium CG_4_10_14_3_um_filter_63_21]
MDAGRLSIGGAGILWFLGRREALMTIQPTPDAGAEAPPWWRVSGPYLALQFCFGGLFSALFIFYFKSSSHFLAILWALGLGVILVANEFLEDRYRRFALTWALFGLCAMLLLNFVVPHVVGNISAIWFYLSTLAGAGLAHLLHLKTPGQPGRIKPVWGIAAGLILAYLVDAIPPVPLVNQDIAVGHALVKANGEYRLQQEKAPWWIFWRKTENEIHLASSEPLFCVAAIFAPTGLDTRLYHHWRYYSEKQGWETRSRIGFNLSGGRQGGYRGYSFKRNLAPGKWSVAVETEDGRTVAIHRFVIADAPLAIDAPMWLQSL